MRNFFYIFLGFLAGLIGILFSQVLLLIPLIDYLPSFFSKAALFLFPITSTALAVSMVWGEIFLNNPTRFKALHHCGMIYNKSENFKKAIATNKNENKLSQM